MTTRMKFNKKKEIYKSINETSDNLIIELKIKILFILPWSMEV